MGWRQAPETVPESRCEVETPVTGCQALRKTEPALRGKANVILARSKTRSERHGSSAGGGRLWAPGAPRPSDVLRAVPCTATQPLPSSESAIPPLPPRFTLRHGRRPCPRRREGRPGPPVPVTEARGRSLECAFDSPLQLLMYGPKKL